MHGSWNERAVDQINEFARTQDMSEAEGEDIKHLFLKLGIPLIWANAAKFISRIRNHTNPTLEPAPDLIS